MHQLLRNIPSVETLLRSEPALRHGATIMRTILADLARNATDEIREKILQDRFSTAGDVQDAAHSLFLAKIDQLLSPSLRRVINCTGVILHTGLGRAVIPESAQQRLSALIDGYCNLELDLDSGGRGDRAGHVEALLTSLTGAESACVVNNNAAAVMLALNALANRKEVVISRGELVEIGGSFRIPDIMKKSGAKMVEIGTTNKTHLSDYADAVSSRTAGILHVHTSNYRVQGFTASPDLSELVSLAHENGLFVLNDLGGGVLCDLKEFGLPHEPVVQAAVAAGVDVITFSGDKIIGGPQSGIIVGKKKFVQRIRKNPLMRVLRCDKFTYALLAETLRLFLNKEQLVARHPVFAMLTTDKSIVRQRGQEILKQLSKLKTKFELTVCESSASVGSGALPLEKIPSYALKISGAKRSVVELATKLRKNDPAILGYVKKHALFLDMRTVQGADFDTLRRTLKAII